MFSLILDCPYCSRRFNYDLNGDLPEEIHCPLCGGTADKENFSAIIFCQECRKKLKIPLNLFHEEVSCPHCSTLLKPDSSVFDEDASTYTLGGTRHSSSERLLNDGDTFDKYRIVRMLGKGGMAEVYLAEHLLLKQLCALKLMQKTIAAEDPVFIQRFIREAKLSHKFTHPNIVKVVDAGTDFKTGYLFLAMEYVDGKTLSQLIREKKMTEKELLEMLSAMLQALKVLNDANVVHRDIKPSNIMLSTDGVYKLMDLGIAKSNCDRQAGELTLTLDRSTLGTPGYASPEQCRSAHDADIRSDIYCLGATLYHAASGVVPFDGKTTMEIILKVIQGDNIPLSKYRPDLSRKFLNLIARMMETDPEKRPGSPQEIIDQLGKNTAPLSCFFREQITRFKKAIFHRSRGSFRMKKSTQRPSVTPRSKVVPAPQKAKNSWLTPVLLLIFAVILTWVWLLRTDNTAPAASPKPKRISAVIPEWIRQRTQTKPIRSRNNKPTQATIPSRKPAQTAVTHRRPVQTAVTHRRPAPVSATLPPLKKLNRTIPVRLQECRQRYQTLKQQPDSEYKSQALAFVSKQIEELTRQQQIRKQVLTAKKNNYSARKTQEFIDAVQRYYNSRRNRGGYSSADIRQGEIFAAMLKDPEVDPNVFFTGNPENGKVFLANLIIDNHLQYKSNFVKCVIQKKTDLNLICWNLIRNIKIGGYLRIPSEFWFFGIEDVDTPLSVPAVFTLFNTGGDPWHTVGSRISDTSVNEFLYLAPKVDVLYPIDGSTLMHLAAKYNKIDLAKNLHLAGFSLFKKQDNSGKTPWDIAQEYGSTDVANFLESLGHDTPSSQNDNRQLELYNALRTQNVDKIRELVGKADFHKPFFNGLTAVEYACSLNNVSLLRHLKACGVDLNPDGKYTTAFSNLYQSFPVAITHPLQIAVIRQNNEMLKFLLQQGFSSSIPFPHYMGGRAPLSVIILFHARRNLHNAENNIIDMIKTLIQYDKTFDINQCVAGNLLLANACRQFFRDKNVQLELVKLLLKNGAKIEYNGQTGYLRNWHLRISDPRLRKLLETYQKNPEEALKKDFGPAPVTNNYSTFNGDLSSLPPRTLNRTISRRIAECEKRLEKVRQRPEFALKQEMISFINKQISTLKKQQKIADMAEKAQKKKYSAARTSLFRQEAERIFNAHKQGKNFTRQEWEQLLKMLADPTVDPNTEITYDGRKYILLDVCSKSYNYPKDRFIKLLLQKRVNVDKSTYRYLDSAAILYGGMQDIDVFNTYLLKRFADEATPLRKNGQVKLGKYYRDEPLKTFLTLAPNLNDRNSSGVLPTILHTLAARNQANLIKQLYLAGELDPNVTNSNGHTPWQLALLRGSKEAVDMMKQLKLDTSHTQEMWNQLQFCQAIRNKDHSLLTQCLKAGADPYKPWFNEINALQNACSLENIQAVKILLEHKVDPNRISTVYARFAVHYNPLEVVIESGNTQLLALLLQYGIRTDETMQINSYRRGFAPILIERRMRKDKNASTIIALLSTQMKYDKSWNINQKYRNKSLLWHCMDIYTRSWVCQATVYNFLLKKGADHNAPEMQDGYIVNKLSNLKHQLKRIQNYKKR